MGYDGGTGFDHSSLRTQGRLPPPTDAADGCLGLGPVREWMEWMQGRVVVRVSLSTAASIGRLGWDATAHRSSAISEQAAAAGGTHTQNPRTTGLDINPFPLAFFHMRQASPGRSNRALGFSIRNLKLNRSIDRPPLPSRRWPLTHSSVPTRHHHTIMCMCADNASQLPLPITHRFQPCVSSRRPWRRRWRWWRHCWRCRTASCCPRPALPPSSNNTTSSSRRRWWPLRRRGTYCVHAWTTGRAQNSDGAPCKHTHTTYLHYADSFSSP